jgi:hypothetical protein
MFKDWRANAICSQRLTCSKWFPENVTKTAFHGCRTSLEFPQILLTVPCETSQLYYIINFAQYGFRKCSRMHTKRREWLPSALTFQNDTKDGDEFLSHIETWGSFVFIGSQGAAKAVDAHTFTKQADEVETNFFLSARKLMTNLNWDRA